MKGSFKIKLSLLISSLLLLQSCASSDYSRSTANQLDNMYLGTGDAINQLGKGTLSDAYENADQTTRGVFIGGAAGALVGSMSGFGIVPGAAGGAVFGGIIGYFVERHSTIIDQLENRGVKVFVIGDQMMLVLPSAQIFQNRTPKINPQSFDTLNLIATLLNDYTVNMLVKISAYTNECGFPIPVSLSLSQQQADSLERYLWLRVKTRLMTAKGYDGANPVDMRFKKPWSASDNYRVEITLEMLPPGG